MSKSHYSLLQIFCCRKSSYLLSDSDFPHFQVSQHFTRHSMLETQLFNSAENEQGQTKQLHTARTRPFPIKALRLFLIPWVYLTLPSLCREVPSRCRLGTYRTAHDGPDVISYRDLSRSFIAVLLPFTRRLW